jgi:hypothetical protein
MERKGNLSSPMKGENVLRYLGIRKGRNEMKREGGGGKEGKE